MKRYSLRRRILFIVLGFTIILQLFYLYVNVRSFQKRYYAVLRSNLIIIGETLKDNLDFILKKGIPIDRLFGLEKVLKGSLSDSPYLKCIAINGKENKYLYYCDRSSFIKSESIARQTKQLKLPTKQEKYTLRFPLAGFDEKYEGNLILVMDRALILKKVKEIALDTGTIILIAMLSIFDFLFFIVAHTISLPVRIVVREIRLDLSEGRLDRPLHRTGIDFLDMMIQYFDHYRYALKEKWIKLVIVWQCVMKTNAVRTVWHTSLLERFAKIESLLNNFSFSGKPRTLDVSISDPVLIRPAIFLFVFAESLSISFLPLYANDLYQPILNISKEVVLGLPISAFMLSTAVSLPFGGACSDIFGRKKAFLSGASISCMGLLLTGSAQTITMLILYRAIVGMGFGIVYMTVQGYIVDTTNSDNRAEGMAIFLSAFYGGTLCGSAIGGMIADRIGFRILFSVGAVLTLISIVFLYLFISPGPEITKSVKYKRPPGEWLKKMISALPSFKDISRLVSDRNFIALSLFQGIPNKICLIGFVYYLAPLFLKELGNSQSDTGRYIMGYSLMMILLSQTMSKWSDRHGNIKQIIVIGGVFSGVILILFFFVNNTFMIAIGILSLGTVHSLAVPNQAKLASQLGVVQDVGLGSGIGIYRQLERIGNVLAPIILGVLASIFGFAKSLAIIGIYTAFSSLFFLLIYKDEEREISGENSAHNRG